jgi:GntR family transcriptional regulator
MPLHRQVFLVLRDQIASGAFVPGDALPTEEALGKLYDVSRITIRRALQDLTELGYIVRRQGLGTYVADRPVAERPNPHSLRASLQRAQAKTRATVVEFGTRPAPPLVRQALRLREGSNVLYILRVRSQGVQPVMLTEAWLPEHHADAVTAVALGRSALYELLESSGVRLGRFVQEITAEIADPTRARLLGTNIGSALLRIDRLVHDQRDDPVMFNTIVVDARRSRILSDVEAADIDTAATGVLVHDNPAG